MKLKIFPFRALPWTSLGLTVPFRHSDKLDDYFTILFALGMVVLLVYHWQKKVFCIRLTI